MPVDPSVQLSPEAEELLAFRLAKKVLIYITAIFTPVILLLSWLGYEKYSDLTSAFTQATNQVRARADTLTLLTSTLRGIINEQTTELASNSKDADRQRDEMTRLSQQAVDNQIQLLTSVSSAVERANGISTHLRASAVGLDSAIDFARNARPQLASLRTAYDSANQNVRQALSLAEEAAVQTVGARQRRHLYGTPFDVYFAGVSGDELRNFMIASHDGATLQEILRYPTNRVLEIEDPKEHKKYAISIVNTLDIPGGLLILRRSRADAATFRVNRLN